MNPEAFADIWVSEDVEPIDACHEITEAAEELRSGVKTNYRGRWLGAHAGDDPHKLYRVMLDTPPDWPGVITVKTKP